MVVRELITLFGFQTDARSIASIDKQIGSLFGKIRGMAAIAGAVAGWMMLKGIAEGVGLLGDEFDTLSQRLGIATDALQEMTFVADRANVSRQELTAGLKALSVNAYEAATGGKEAAATFAKLGVRIRDTDGKLRPVQELFEDAADGLQRLDSDLERTALTQLVFGRTGAALVPMLKDGSSGIKAMRQRAQELGVIMSSELIQKSKAWDESTKDVGSALQGLRNIVADALLPHLERMNRSLTKTIVKHRSVIKTALWQAIDKLGQSVEHVAEFFAMAAEYIGEMAKELSPLQANILKVSAAAAALAVILMLPGGSLLAIIALLALVIDDFMVWKKGGKSVIGDLVGSLNDLEMAVPGVGKAASAVGDMFKREFYGVISLVKILQSIGGSIVALLIGMFVDPEIAINDFGQNVRTIFRDILDAIGKYIGVDLPKIFDVAADVVKAFSEKILNSVVGTFDKIVAYVTEAISTIASMFTGFGDSISSGLEGAIGIFGRLARLGGAPTDGIGGGASGTWTGGASGSWTAGRAPANSSVAQSNKVDITVNVAGGGQNPEAIGRAVARPVEQVMETQLRNAMLDITNAAPGGEF